MIGIIYIENTSLNFCEPWVPQIRRLDFYKQITQQHLWAISS